MISSGGTAEKERRRGPDFLLRAINWIAVSSWFLFLFMLIILDKAKPEVVTIIDRLVGARRRVFWDLKLIDFLFYLMICGVLMSSCGLIANFYRHKRKRDSFRFSFIFIGVLSLAGITYYLFIKK